MLGHSANRGTFCKLLWLFGRRKAKYIGEEQPNMIPSKCEMPDLSDLDTLLRYLLPHVLIGDPGLNRKEGLYRRNFIRLVDKAIAEYQKARLAIIQEVEEAKYTSEEMSRTGRQIFIIDFIDHFENCLNATNRLFKLLEKIKKEELNQNVPGLARKLSEAQAKSIRDFRGTFEHIDEKIQKDEIKEGQPVMLGIGEGGDKAVIGSDYIRFSDVATTLRALHKVGLSLFDEKKGA